MDRRGRRQDGCPVDQRREPRPDHGRCRFRPLRVLRRQARRRRTPALGRQATADGEVESAALRPRHRSRTRARRRLRSQHHRLRRRPAHRRAADGEGLARSDPAGRHGPREPAHVVPHQPADVRQQGERALRLREQRAAQRREPGPVRLAGRLSHFARVVGIWRADERARLRGERQVVARLGGEHGWPGRRGTVRGHADSDLEQPPGSPHRRNVAGRPRNVVCVPRQRPRVLEVPRVARPDRLLRLWARRARTRRPEARRPAGEGDARLLPRRQTADDGQPDDEQPVPLGRSRGRRPRHLGHVGPPLVRPVHRAGAGGCRQPRRARA